MLIYVCRHRLTLPFGIPEHVFPSLIHHVNFETISYTGFLRFLENQQDMKMLRDFFIRENVVPLFCL